MRSTPRYGHAPIEMRRRTAENIDDDLRVGDFNWLVEDGRRTLVVAIPADKDLRPVYSEWTIDHKNHCDAQWSWDGNEDRPTLTPSLHAVGVWHGWVRGGQLVEA